MAATTVRRNTAARYIVSDSLGFRHRSVGRIQGQPPTRAVNVTAMASAPRVHHSLNREPSVSDSTCTNGASTHRPTVQGRRIVLKGGGDNFASGASEKFFLTPPPSAYLGGTRK